MFAKALSEGIPHLGREPVSGKSQAWGTPSAAHRQVFVCKMQRDPPERFVSNVACLQLVTRVRLNFSPLFPCFSKEPNVRHIDPPVTVVGDVHG